MSDIGPEIFQSEKAFSLLVNSVRDYGIFLLTRTGEVASWNPGAERVQGYLADEIIGKHFRIFYPDRDRQALKPENELIIASQTGRFEDEGWRVKKDGTRFWANAILVAVRNDKGETIGFGKIVRDFTRRHGDEIRYRQLIENVTEYAIFSLDPTGHVTSWNVGAERIKQYKESEILGRHYSTFYTPEDLAKGIPQHNLEVAARTGRVEGEGWRVRKDGTRFWSNVVITAMRDEQGELIGFSKITRDVTDRKMLLDQIQQHAAELEYRIQERDRMYSELEAFSYSISHDLRAPLRAIEGFAEALREDLGDSLTPEAAEDLRQVTSAADRMAVLIGDLLEYSRLATTKMEVAVVDVADLVREVLGHNLPHIAEVKTSVEPGLRVIAHRTALVQALLNLVENALKFHKPGASPRVTVGASRNRQNVRIFVQDEGIGMAREHHQRIFQVFQRLHTAKEYPGTGIGLALVKRIAQRLGGNVSVESELGKGSTFWIEIPAA